MNFINPERNSSEGLEEVVGEIKIKETAPVVELRTSLIESIGYVTMSSFYGLTGEVASEIMISRGLIKQEFTMPLFAGIIASALYPAPVETWLTKYKKIVFGTVLGIAASYYLMRI